MPLELKWKGATAVTEEEKIKVATVGEAFEIMLAASDSAHRSASYLERMVKVLVPVIIALLLGCGFLIWQVKDRDHVIEQLESTVVSLKSSSSETRDASIKAQLAAESAKSSLDAAIANSQRQTDNSTTAINRINEIYDTCVVRKEC